MKLDLIGIVTQDMKTSLAFYRHIFTIPDGLDNEGHVEITLENGLRFAWDTVAVMQSFEPHYTFAPKQVAAFLCDDAADVDRKYHELIAKGGPGAKEPWDAFWGQRYALVADPDGNILDLFAPLN
jgi:catechol 2,3-dioxygenase-like lactoylglutathione lyase family enzyme